MKLLPSWLRRDTKAEQRAALTVDWDTGSAPPNPANISPEAALRVGAVWSAGDRLAGSIASMPLQTYQRGGTDRKKIDPPNLLVKPSQQGSMHDWVFRAVTSLAYRGNAIGMITGRDSYQYPTQVEWLHPDWVAVRDDLPSGPGSFIDPIWYYRGVPIDAEHLVHIPWFVMPGKVLGLSPIGAYATAVRTALGAQTYTDDWFKAGGTPPGVFRNQNQTIPQDDANVIKKRFVKAIQSHEPIVFGNDWEYTPLGVSANDISFIETMKLTTNQIAAIYGIPPEMIGGETGHSMTYQNVEQQSINFVQFTLLPWLSRLESAFTNLLAPNQYVKFNVDALIRTDAAVRMKNYELARMIGKNSINEIRELEDEAPIAGGDDHTPLPIQAGKPIPLPQLRDGAGHLRLVDNENRIEGAN